MELRYEKTVSDQHEEKLEEIEHQPTPVAPAKREWDVYDEISLRRFEDDGGRAPPDE